MACGELIKHEIAFFSRFSDDKAMHKKENERNNKGCSLVAIDEWVIACDTKSICGRKTPKRRLIFRIGK